MAADIFEKEYEKSLAEKDGSSIFNAFQTGYKADSFVTNDVMISFDGNFFYSDDLNHYISLKNVEKLIVKKLSENIDIDCVVSRNENILDFSPSNLYHFKNHSLGRIDGIIKELLSLKRRCEDDYGPSEENRFEVSIFEHLENNGESILTIEKWINTGITQQLLPWPICPKFSDLFENFTNILCIDIQSIMLLAKIEIQKTVKLEALRGTNDRIYKYNQKHIPLTREIINAAENPHKDELGVFFREWTGSKRFDFFEKPVFSAVKGDGYRFKVTKNGVERELADLGYGTRQVLPVILGMFNNKQITFIIEEPESNLHPKLQSLLADLFVEVKRKNPDSPLIIETHSEYLIRKLQYIVATNEISPGHIAIHYIGGDSGNRGKDIFQINIEKDGSLDKDFGTGFFDVATNWRFELMRIKHEQKN